MSDITHYGKKWLMFQVVAKSDGDITNVGQKWVIRVIDRWVYMRAFSWDSMWIFKEKWSASEILILYMLLLLCVLCIYQYTYYLYVLVLFTKYLCFVCFKHIYWFPNKYSLYIYSLLFSLGFLYCTYYMIHAINVRMTN